MRKLREGIPPEWDHQVDQHDFTEALYEAEHAGALIAVEMGGGKTRPTIRFGARPEFLNTLVLCPTSVVDVWVSEIEKFWPYEDPHVLGVAHRGGDGAKGARVARQAMERRHPSLPFWFITNYESIARKTSAIRKFVDSVRWDLTIADEGHRLKAPSGKTSQAAARLAANARFAIALTGTPLPQGIIDAFGLMRFVDPSIFGPSITNFRARYFRRAQTWDERNRPDRQWLPTGPQVECYVPQNTLEFEDKMRPVTFRVRTEDVLDLPESIEHEIKVTLEPAASKAYIEVERHLIAEFEDGAITAANAMVKMLRLQQVTAGRRIPTDTGEVNYLSKAKMNALADILDDLPPSEPVVVFTKFVSDVVAVAEVANARDKKRRLIRGGLSQLTGQANQLKEWQRGETRVLAVNPQAGGVGVDMTRARYAVWYSLPWGLALYEQAKARLVRPGQTRSVEFIKLTAQLTPVGSTIDTIMAASLDAKGDLVEALMAALAERAADRRSHR